MPKATLILFAFMTLLVHKSRSVVINDTDGAKSNTTVNVLLDGRSIFGMNPILFVVITISVVIACYCACCCIISFCECANFAAMALGKSVTLKADNVHMDLGDFSLNLASVFTDDKKYLKKALPEDSTNENTTDSRSLKLSNIHLETLKLDKTAAAGQLQGTLIETPAPDTIRSFNKTVASQQSSDSLPSMPPPSKETVLISDTSSMISGLNTTKALSEEMLKSVVSSSICQSTPPFSRSVSTESVKTAISGNPKLVAEPLPDVVTSKQQFVEYAISPMTAESATPSNIFTIPSTVYCSTESVPPTPFSSNTDFAVSDSHSLASNTRTPIFHRYEFPSGLQHSSLSKKTLLPAQMGLVSRLPRSDDNFTSATQSNTTLSLPLKNSELLNKPPSVSTSETQEKRGKAKRVFSGSGISGKVDE